VRYLLALITVGWLTPASAETPAQWVLGPTVTIVAADNDPRIGYTHEAIELWNRTLAEFGSAFRLGPVRQIAEGAPGGDELEMLSSRILRGLPGLLPPSFARLPGDMVIVLSEGRFVAFAARSRGPRKAMVAMPTNLMWPYSQPNFSRYALAHEIGHALGLGHNEVPTMLMCGSAIKPCDRDVPVSDMQRFMALTDVEKTQLRTAYPGRAPTWSKPPSITVLGVEGDPRIALVHEAVDHWNAIFTEIGSPFRLGAIRLVPGGIPPEELRVLSGNIVGRGGATVPMRESVAAVAGNLVVALSDSADFISFAARWPKEEKALAAIRSHLVLPLSLPNVARNVVAHEIGHALGLGHNRDPAMLMCGRPAPCRPDATQSNTPRIFPLTADEKQQLRSMYPSM
jgi:hypothetical protein